MKQSDRLTLRSSEIRERLNEIAGLEGDALTDEIRTEERSLQTEYRDVETKLRAAITAEGEPQVTETHEDPEQRELRELNRKADLGLIVSHVLGLNGIDGAEAELQGHYKLAGNQIPLDMLRREERAVTPAPANTGAVQHEIIPDVFPMSCAAFLGVDMPTVGIGEQVYPVLSASASAGTPAKDASQAETTGGFTADALSPSRIQASFFYRREDRATFAGMDDALRENLSDALEDKLDQQILAGPNGLFSADDGSGSPVLANNAASAVTSYAAYRQLAYGNVDGKWAGSVSDIRILFGSGTYSHASGIFRSENAGDRAALEDLMQATAGVKVSAHVPAVASNKQNCIVRLGMRRDMVAPLWEGITLIPDEVTLAKKGQIMITAVMLHAVKILRAGGFKKVETQHA